MNIVTGFDGFRGHTVNPSAEFGRRVALLTGATYVQVPVTYHACLNAVRTAVYEHLGADGQPASVLMLGRAAGERGLRLERTGRAAATSKHPDNDGIVGADLVHLPAIPPDAPASLETKTDLGSILRTCRQSSPNLQVHISDNAGGYVCNALYYSVLATYPAATSLFVHLDGLHFFQQSQTGHDSQPAAASTGELDGQGRVIDVQTETQAPYNDILQGLLCAAEAIAQPSQSVHR